MIELSESTLVLRFPQVHSEAVLRLRFLRTLRLPDDNREYPLPPGLGSFPLVHVEDHAARLPAAWVERGGVMLPMYQSEAMWISFGGGFYPFAIKIAAGKINAVSGEAWSQALVASPQDYLVAPDQPWLDGFCVKKGVVRQFVAMPLGQGYTAEEQVTGKGEHGGLQILVCPMKAEHYEKLQARRMAYLASHPDLRNMRYSMCCSEPPMGLAPGGLMRQHLAKDRHGCDVWDQANSSRCFVHILNSRQWAEVTQLAPPSMPVSAATYAAHGLPWFEYYADGLQSLPGAKPLAELDSVAAKGVKLGESPLADNAAVDPAIVVPLGPGAVHPGQVVK